MKIYLVEWAARQRLRPIAKLVLIALAMTEETDEETGVILPIGATIQNLAIFAGVVRKQAIQHAIEQLIAKGLIMRWRAPKGRAYLYAILLDRREFE